MFRNLAHFSSAGIPTLTVLHGPSTAGGTKAAQFFQLCDQSRPPIVFVHNTTGYMVGTEYERAGMIKHGAKMIQVMANVRVPKIALFADASFGAGNYGMCGLAYDPDFLFAWPNAAKTITRVAEITVERSGKPVDRAALKAQEERIIVHFVRQKSAFYTAGRNLSHGVIDPRDIRSVLDFGLETCLEALARDLQPNSIGVARM